MQSGSKRLKVRKNSAHPHPLPSPIPTQAIHDKTSENLGYQSLLAEQGRDVQYKTELEDARSRVRSLQVRLKER
jgi:hypothetical protein